MTIIVMLLRECADAGLIMVDDDVIQPKVDIFVHLLINILLRLILIIKNIFIPYLLLQKFLIFFIFCGLSASFFLQVIFIFLMKEKLADITYS